MSQIAQSVIVHPMDSVSGSVSVPGDKSIGHRIAMLAGLASGTSTVKNFPQSGDCLSTLRAMEALGARTFASENGELNIQGTGGNLLEPAGPLNVGNSGTSMRLLAGIIAGQRMTIEMTGDESLCTRPMGRIKDPLEKMGASVELTGEKGTAPIKVKGGALKAIDYMLPIASAQVKSCILLAGLYAEGTTTVREPVPSRDHTERLLRELGIPVIVDGLQIQVKGFGAKGPTLKATKFFVPGDFSSAAYWMVIVAARKKGSVTVKHVGLNPRRTAFLEVLRNFGADVDVKMRGKSGANEPVGDVKVTAGKLKGTVVGGADVPNMIDELPLVAVLGALAEGTTTIKNASELRVKETDRIAAMASNLRLLGVEVEETEDGMIVQGPAKLKPTGPIKSYGDHRMAMSMAILATYATGPVVINNVACVDTSYPAFWDDLCGSWGARLNSDVLVVAIDGPSASGKSTVARRSAQELGFCYVDSGALYRGMTWKALREGIDPHDSGAVVDLLGRVKLEFFLQKGQVWFSLDGEDPGEQLRSEAVAERVSDVAAIPEVRSYMVRKLRSTISFGHVVMEGRDIGTVVFPDTPFKFYLDANPEERARRRHQELSRSSETTVDNVLDSLTRRDTKDTTRKTAPLQIALGARIIDSTSLSIDEVVKQVVQQVKAGSDFDAMNENPSALVYFITRVLSILFLKIWCRYSAHGAKNIPRKGGCVIASNHASYLDPPLVGIGIWSRRVRYLARDTLFRHKWFAWYLYKIGVVPLSRERGDIGAMKKAIQLLKNGACVCLYPEGTRTTDGRLQPAKGGIGFLIAKAGAPVVPAYIDGSFKALGRDAKWVKPAHCRVFFGKPIPPEEFASLGSDRESYDKIGQLVMERIAQLKPME